MWDLSVGPVAAGCAETFVWDGLIRKKITCPCFVSNVEYGQNSKGAKLHDHWFNCFAR